MQRQQIPEMRLAVGRVERVQFEEDAGTGHGGVDMVVALRRGKGRISGARGREAWNG